MKRKLVKIQEDTIDAVKDDVEEVLSQSSKPIPFTVPDILRSNDEDYEDSDIPTYFNVFSENE
jgi:hypothetical protein